MGASRSSCSTWSASPTPASASSSTRSRCPAGCASACSSPWPWHANPSCSSPTSRRPPSTSRSRRRSSTSSPTSSSRLDVAVLLITHDLGVVAGVCDRVAVMYAGKIVEDAAAADLYATPAHPYSIGTAAVDASRRRRARPPRRHPRCAARPAPAADGLRLRRPLRARHRPVPKAAAGARSARPAATIASSPASVPPSCAHPPDYPSRSRHDGDALSAALGRPGSHPGASDRGRWRLRALPRRAQRVLGPAGQVGPRRRRRVLHRPPRRDARARRRVGLGQDHRRAHGAPAHRSDRGPDHLPRRRTSPPRGRGAAQVAPAHAARLPGSVRVAEPADVRAPARRRAARRARPGQVGELPLAIRSSPCSSAADSRRTPPTVIPTPSPAVSASASASPGRWPCSPTSSSPTNRCRPSTCRCGRRSSTCSRTCNASSASPTCSSPTTCPSSATSPTASPSSTPASWSSSPIPTPCTRRRGTLHRGAAVERADPRPAAAASPSAHRAARRDPQPDRPPPGLPLPDPLPARPGRLPARDPAARGEGARPLGRLLRALRPPNR